MKSTKALLMIFLLATIYSVEVKSQSSSTSQDIHWGHVKPVTRAPLDGGLLSILGVAGVAYYVARKNGKNKES
jgi:hypothetical protein